MFANDLERFGPQSTAEPLALRQSRRYCRQLAHQHYENFTVASRLVPRRLRQHICNIYAYCRWADDLADELGDPERSLTLLGWWETQLRQCYHGMRRGKGDSPIFVDHGFAAVPAKIGTVPVHPVFIALAETIRQFNIPAEPFVNLLVAFRQDQRVTRYETTDQLLDYCRYSANPVGRLVLYLGGCHTPDRARLSDSICTGLQLANFWQDVARDWDNGRIYLPQIDCRRFGYDEASFARREPSEAFRRLLAVEVDQAEGWLRGGMSLAAQMSPGLQVPVALFVQGGLATLEAIRRQNYDVWTRRPTVSKLDKLRLLVRCWWKR